MKKLRVYSTALLAAFALAACGEDPVQPGTLANNGPLGHANGLVEVTISGIGSDQMSSVAHYIPGAESGSQSNAAASGISRVSPMSGRLHTTNVPNGLEISAFSTSSFTYGERGNGGYRYVSATYKVRNAPAVGGTGYAHVQKNVTFLAVNGSSACSGSTATLDGTGLCSLKKFDGNSADVSLAQQVLPTGGAAISPNTGRLTSYPADVLQVYEETDVSDVPLPTGGTSILPYGFVVRTSSSSNRDLAASPGTGVYGGYVTFAFRVPLQATKDDDPFTVSALFLPVEDDNVVVTQSLEEADQASIDLITTRATALTGASVLTLTGHAFSVATNSICSVRSAGTSGSPAAYLVNGLANEVTPAPFTSAASFINKNSFFTLSACRMLHAATSSNFVVNGGLSGWLHDTYATGDAVTISTPARTGGYFAGEELQVSLTANILDAGDNQLPDPRVLLYRVAPTAGTGAFGTATTNGAGMAPSGVATADLNGDGKLDIVVADGDASTVTVLMGNGNGTFAAGVPYEGGGDATPDVALGDVNHDGNVDIIAAARFNMIGVLLGNGDGTFGTASTYSTIFGINHLTVGDFNADGNLDVLTDGFTGSGGILMGDGSGGFTQVATFSAPQGRNIALGDFNGDGKLDFVTAGSFGIRTGIGDGSGGFSVSMVGTAGAQAWVAVADVNGDGKPDVVYADNGGNGLGVMLGDGLGGFDAAGSSPFSTVNGAAALAVGDVNHDGKLDVITTDGGSPDASVTVMAGNGSGSFAAVGGTTVDDGGDLSLGVILGDFNGDGALDVATVNYSSSDVSVLLGTP